MEPRGASGRSGEIREFRGASGSSGEPRGVPGSSGEFRRAASEPQQGRGRAAAEPQCLGIPVHVCVESCLYQCRAGHV
eukprot:15471205-Alexandrium_andersonii.AAC.1